MEKKKRQSNFELLRIISMFLIVLGHVTWQTHFSFPINSPIKNTAIQSLWIGGEFGVWLFMLISAYFLSKTSFKKKRFFSTWKLTIFYSGAIYLFLLLTKNINFSFGGFIKSFFPVIMGSYWFVTSYLVVYLLSPFLNLLIDKLNKKRYQQLICLLGVVFLIVPNIFRNVSVSTENVDGGGTVFILIIIYLIGGYFRKYSEDFTKRYMKRYVTWFIISLLMMIVSIYVINLFKNNSIGLFNHYRSYGLFLKVSSPFQAVCACSFFLIFKNINIKTNKLINFVASSTFAIYLIHTQVILFPILWGKIICLQRYEGSKYIIAIEVIVALIVFITCLFIDIVRRFVMKLIMRFKFTYK